ncbi:MAG: fibronectin type III domain-containing protein [Bacteroidota bacterium]|jgi:hypothetical protein
MKKFTTYFRFILLACSVLAGIDVLYAQSIANYNTPSVIQRTTGITYGSIEYTGYSFPAWRNNVVGNSTEDDNRSEQVGIGFDFWYNGIRYTDFSVSTNGFIDFSSATYDGGPGTGSRTYWPYGPYDEDLSTPNRTVPVGGSVLSVAPFYYDLTTQGETDPLGSSIKYLVTGTAPNRILTVEWMRMAVWGNTSPSLNFQVKLYEGSGVIEFIYGTMTSGSVSWAYSCGINGPALSSSPTAAQLLLQQSPNSTTFSNANGTGAQNLSTVPASNTKIIFTPPAMSAPTGLTFSGITQTATTLNWTDASSNEVGFAIYRSDDGGATYNFIAQTAANATSYTNTGLLAGTTYYYKVYAVNEGRLSSALTGNQATASPGSPYTTSSGSWKNPGTWSTGMVPGISDNATISDGTVIYIDTTVTVNSLTVGQGTSGVLLIGNDNTARSITVIGNIDVKAGGILRVNGASNTSGHTIASSGNILNAGRFVMATDADSRCAVTFNKSGTQTVSGSGDSTHFYTMTLNMGSSKDNILDVFATNFTVSGSNFLTITNGTFNLATGANVTPFTSTVTIPSTGGIKVNHSAAVLNTTGGNLVIAGDLKVQNGSLNVGNTANQNLASSGGSFDFSGGTTTVAGRFEPNNNYVITNFAMSGGTLIVAATGSTSTTNAPFTMNVSGSSFTMSGGTIRIEREGGGGSDDLGFLNTGYSTYSVTGGTLQIGDGSTPLAQTMRINTTIPVYNVLINSANATGTLVTNNIIVKNDLSVAIGTFNANGLNMTVGGNWSDAGTFTPSTGKVTFDGTGTQTIVNTGGETFNKLTIDKSSGSVVPGNDITVADSMNIVNGTLDIGTNMLIVNSVFVNTGTLQTNASGTVNYNQNSNGQSVLAFNYSNLMFSNFTKILPGGVIGISGAFTPGTASGHTVTGNTIDFNSSGSQNIPSFQYNNLTLSNTGAKTLQADADSVLGNLTIGAGNSLATNGVNLNVFGDIANSGSQSGTGSIIFKGSSVQSLTGGGVFQNLTMNNSTGVSMIGNTTVNGVLTLTSGVISTSDSVVVSPSGSVSRTSGHINGWLKKTVATGATSITYEIGDAANYTPAQFSFANVTTSGTLTVHTVSADHPDIISSFIDPTNNVNRYWETRNSGLVYTAGSGYSLTLTYVGADCDVAGNASFRLNWFNGAYWDSTTAGTNTTSTNQATGIDSLGTYAVGLQVTSGAYRSVAATGNWNSTSTWERFNGVSWVPAVATPTSANAGLITIRSGTTVTVTAAVTIDQTVVESGGTLINQGTNLTLNTVNNALTVNGILRQEGTAIGNATAARLIFNAGSEYQHARTTQLARTAIPTATWSPTSTVRCVGNVSNTSTTTFTNTLNQTFGNFIWAPSAQSAVVTLIGRPTTIEGNFQVVQTGSSSLVLYSTQTTTMTIGGSFIVNGGTVTVKNNTGAATLIIGGNDSITGGTVNLSSSGAVYKRVSGGLYVTGGTYNLSSGTANDSITIGGNLVLSGGTMTETSSGSGIIALRGTSVQNFSSGSTISNNINFTVFSGSTLNTGSGILTGQSFTLQSGGSLRIGSPTGIASSGATGNIQTTTRTFNSGANYIFAGNAAQFTGIFTTTPTANTVNNLEIDNSSGVSMSGNIAVSDSLNLLAGDLAVGTSTLTINNVAYLTSGTLSSSATGTVNYNKVSNGQYVFPMNYGNLIFSNFNKTLPAGTIGVAGTFTPGSATGHITTGNTIDFNGTTAQNVPAWTYYNNLSISGSNWKQLKGNSIVTGNLSVSSATLSDSIYSLTVKGNILNSSVITGYGSNGKTILSSGTSSHGISGTGSYWILEIDDAFGATVSSDITIDSLLILTDGIISTGTNTIICNSSPGTYRPLAGGHVNGRIRKTVSAVGTPTNYTFEIGDASNYTPIDLTFQSVSVAGTVTAYQTPGDHPLIKYSGLDQTKSVNRYFTLAGTGLTFTTYDATMNFVSSDIDAGANTAYFFVKRYNSPLWYPSTVNVRQSTSTRTLGLTAFGDFAVGEASTTFYWTQGAGTHNWGDDYNWSSHSVPTAGNTVYFDGDDTVDVNVDGVCKDLILINDTLQVTILAGKTLTVNGNMAQYSGIFSTRGSFPIVSGAVTFSGGTFGYDSSGGTQTVAVQSYQNLRLTGGGTKTAAGSFIVNKNLTIGNSVTFADGGGIISVLDSITNNGTHTGSGKILLNGSVQHQITGIGSFTNLQLNNTSNGANLDSNITVNGTLTLTSGVITAPNDTLFISSTGTIVRSTGYVNGNLRKYFGPATDSLSFEIGSVTNYLPVTVSFGTITTGGNLTVQMISTEHPDVVNSTVDPDSSINRYWTLNNNGISFNSYNVTFNWSSSDVDAGVSDFSDFIVAIKSNGNWDEMESGTTTPVSIRGMNGTSFSSFAVGKPSSKTFTSVQTGNWSTGSTWDLNQIPKKRDKVIIVSPHIVTLVDARKIARITLNPGATLADGGNILDLYGSFSLGGTWNGTGVIRWNGSTTDTLSGTSGKTSGTPTLYVNGSNKLITAVNDTIYRIEIPSAYTVTNSGSVHITRLIGGAAGSTWVNGAGAIVSVSDTLLYTGTLNATASNNTVKYDGTGNQTVKATNFTNLTLTGSRTTNAVTLPASVIGISGSFTPSATFTSGGYITASNTIDFNSSGAQTIPAFGYNNLTISGARSNASVTLVNGDTIKVAGIFSPAATAVNYVTANNSMNFNGIGAQSIPVFAYNNLQTSTGGTKTVAGNLSIYGNFTIGVSTTFDASSSSDSLYGNWTNNGTFTPSTSVLVLKGSSASAITGATTFNTIIVSKNSSTTAVTLNNNVQAGTVTMSSGTVHTGSNTLTITTSRSGNGIILGHIRRTHTFTHSTAYEFESPNNTITFSNMGVMPTSVTVDVVLDSSTIVNPNMNPINRYYAVSQTGGSGLQYALKLHYEDAELGTANSETTPPLKLWRDSSGTWVRIGVSSNNTTSNWVQFDSVTAFSTFSLSSRTLTNIAMTLTADVTHPVPGDQVTYTISYNNSGDGYASNFIIAAPIPLSTTYVPGSISVDGTPKADGAAGISVTPSLININLSTILGHPIWSGSSGNITYKVSIN